MNNTEYRGPGGQTELDPGAAILEAERILACARDNWASQRSAQNFQALQSRSDATRLFWQFALSVLAIITIVSLVVVGMICVP